MFDSIMKGLDEAVKISNNELKGRKHKIVVMPLPEMSNKDIKKIRQDVNLTQSTFASVLGVSKKTIEGWENGRNTPRGPAVRLLEMIKSDPGILEKQHLLSR